MTFGCVQFHGESGYVSWLLLFFGWQQLIGCIGNYWALVLIPRLSLWGSVSHRRFVARFHMLSPILKGMFTASPRFSLTGGSISWAFLTSSIVTLKEIACICRLVHNVWSEISCLCHLSGNGLLCRHLSLEWAWSSSVFGSAFVDNEFGNIRYRYNDHEVFPINSLPI